MNKIILHIPHSSIQIPFYDGYLVDEKVLKEERLLLTDWYTDDLFNHPDTNSVVADFSRIFCDVERFSNDSIEIMSKVGMGVLYENRDNGTPLRKVTDEMRTRVLEEFYNPHHQRLNDAIEKQLSQFGKALILDCHSFPNIPFKRDLNQNLDRPDYNIGADEFHTASDLLEVAKQFFIDRNLTFGINTPYSGSIVPMKYYGKNINVQTIMLEINRKLYLNGNTNDKSENYQVVKETVQEFITDLFYHFQIDLDSTL